MITVFVVCMVIVLVVLLLAVITTSKAYSFKHTVDSLDHNSENKEENNNSPKKFT